MNKLSDAKIEFEERAVAFIDILGFKGIVGAAIHDVKAKENLQKLVDLLDSAVPELNKQVNQTVQQHLIPKHNYISDCIILSAPMQDEVRTDYNGLGVLVMRVIQISHMLYSQGYIVSGGISVGLAWHTATNIIGPAYQEAYIAETKNIFPCVVLTEAAELAWNNCSYSSSRMCKSRNGRTYVNGLDDAYIQGKECYGKIEETYKLYRQHISSVLASRLPHRAKRKWQWMLNFLNHVEANC